MGVKGLSNQGDSELNQHFLTSLCDWTRKLAPLLNQWDAKSKPINQSYSKVKPINQSNVKLKPIATRSFAFPALCKNLLESTLSSYWIFVKSSLALIGLCDPFAITTLYGNVIELQCKWKQQRTSSRQSTSWPVFYQKDLGTRLNPR